MLAVIDYTELTMGSQNALANWAQPVASLHNGSEGGPVTLPVFKTGDWRLAASMVRSTRTRFRQYSQRLASFLTLRPTWPLPPRLHVGCINPQKPSLQP